MKVQGSLQNRLYESMANQPHPEVGMGVTICSWSDRRPATITRVHKSGKTMWIREDEAIRLDKNGMSDQQEYRFEPRGDDYPEQICRRQRNGSWKIISGSNLLVGHRMSYHDYTF